MGMASEQLPIVFDEDGLLFEHMAKENGKRTWSARALMNALGYDKWPTFKKVIEKSMSACALLGIDIFQHFSPVNSIDGRRAEDFTLSRFACCMIALNGDSKNHNVAAAQAYFVSIAETLADQRIEHAESMDRIAIREEITDREVTLSSAAGQAGVESYPAFKTAGYIGMYEMDYHSLRALRGVSSLPKRSLLDFMGKDELAGNLFRLSLTEGRIRREGTRGQKPLERVAHEVGQRVRSAMKQELGVFPEQLQNSQDIREVKKSLKKAGSNFSQIDDIDADRLGEKLFLEGALQAPSQDAIPGCPECAGGNPASHYGSQACTSGSLASGGTVSHCTCEFCY